MSHFDWPMITKTKKKQTNKTKTLEAFKIKVYIGGQGAFPWAMCVTKKRENFGQSTWD